MRKTTSLWSSLASRLLALTVMVFVGMTQAFAAPVELGDENQPIEPGVEYLIKQYSSASATYTPATSGKLVTTGQKSIALYTGPEHEDSQLMQGQYLNYGSYAYDVTKDQTIYFYSGFSMDTDVFTFYMEGVVDFPLEIAYLTPELDSPIDFNLNPDMLITFNQTINVPESPRQPAVISFLNRITNQQEAINQYYTNEAKQIKMPIYPAVKAFLASGALKPKDELTITIPGVVSSISGKPLKDADAQGNIVLKYQCGTIPLVKTAQYIPDPFLSYWPAGVEEGILKLTFNGNLGTSDKSYAEIVYGNVESENGFYVEQLPVKIEGNVASVDFTGKLRTPQTMTPLAASYTYENLIIKVGGLVDENGFPVGSEGLGTVGSYTFNPAYKVVSSAVVNCEFEPASGADLRTLKNLNVWISGLKGIQFDGFKLTYIDASGNEKTTVVEMKDVTITNASDEEAEYAFAIPAEIYESAKTLTVTLNNLVSLDGLDHSSDIRAVYGSFAITYANPANGTEMATLKEGTTITIETNNADKYPEMYVVYEIIDLNAANEDDKIIKTESWLNRQEDGSYSAEVAGNFKLRQGHDYKVVFTAWETEMKKYENYEQNLGSDFIIWKGTTPPFVYSALAYEGADPTNESTLAENTEYIVVKFDGAVQLGVSNEFEGNDTFINLGSGMQMPFKSVEALDPQESEGVVYGSQWKLIFPDNFVAQSTAPISISVKAFDMNGNIVKGNTGEEDETYIKLDYIVPGMYAPVTVKFGDGATPISAFDTITVIAEGTIAPTYQIADNAIKVFKGQQIVAEVKESRFPDNWNIVDQYILVLDKTISEPGEYVLDIPEGFFNVGEEGQLLSKALHQTFTVGEKVCQATPAPGVVENLSSIEVDYFKGIEINAESAVRPTIYIPEEDINLPIAQMYVEGNVFHIALNSTITDKGTYQVNIPEGYLKYTEGGASVPAQLFIYTIEDKTPVAEDEVSYMPAPGKVTTVPSVIELTFVNEESVAQSWNGKATLTINGGAPIELPDAEYGIEFNQMNQSLPQEYTADGKYEINFPAGYFVFGENGDRESTALSVTYTIGATSGVAGIEIKADHYYVYNLAGVLVLDTDDAAAVKNLAPGVYVINGLKVAVK